MFRVRWPTQMRLRWCSNCNVPLIQESCGKCGSKGVEVRLNPPADVRPAFDGDLEIIKEAIANEFNCESLLHALNIREGSLVILNKVPHYDDMKEVVVNGVVVGRYFFDPINLKWRWRLSRYSAKVALELGVIKSIVVDKIKPLMTLGTSNDPDDTQYVVLNRVGDVLGLAIVRNGVVRVQTLFSGSLEIPESSKNTTTLDDFVKANDFKLRTLISKGIKHLYVMSSKVGLPLTVSFSGGKDSLVALDLAVRCGLEPKMIFNDTGLELPETLDNVEVVSKYYGLELIMAKPKRSFWEALEVFGPPAKDFRWCCKVIKLIPLSETYKKFFPNGTLNVVGQRGFESIERARSGSVWRNRWIPNVLNITPIQDWPQIAVWSYILTNKLPYNPLYSKGFDRLGCYLCPAANIAEYFIVKRRYPSLWNMWECHLNKWRSRLNLTDEWVKFSLWRWLNPFASGRMRVERRVFGKGPKARWVDEYELRLKLKIVKNVITFHHSKVVFDGELDNTGIVAQSNILGKADVKIMDNEIYVNSEDYSARVSRNAIEVTVKDPSKHSSLDILSLMAKLLLRWNACVSCGACRLWCPSNAIVVEDRPTVNSKCISCGICLEVCPVSEVLVSKVFMPLVINDPKGLKRVRKSKALELSKALRKLHITNTHVHKDYVLDVDQITELFKV